MKIKRILISTSIVLNLVFIAMFGYLIMQRGGLSYVVSIATTTLGWESSEVSENFSPDYLRKQSLYELTPIKEGSTVFLGDSIIGGVEWSELFQSIDFLNRGIPGDNSEGVLNRLNEIVETKPNKIFIMIGVNDLHSDGDSSDLLENYGTIIERIQTDSPNTEIYIQSVLPYNPEKYDLAGTTNMSNELIKSTNDELKKLAENKGATYIGLHSLLVTEEGVLNPEYTFDGLHLTGQAYVVWKEEIEKHLN